MLLGILADSHNHLARTEAAVALLRDAGAEALAHCGDLASPEIVAACAALPFYFVLGNHDADAADDLRRVAEETGATCLDWGGEFTFGGKRIAITHGHMTVDLRPLLEAEPDYLLSGHSHVAHDRREGPTRRINPGALYRARVPTVALLDVSTDELRFLEVAL